MLYCMMYVVIANPCMFNLVVLLCLHILSPAKTSHALLSPEERKRQGIADGLLRFSVGIEDTEDIIQDIEQSIVKATNK